MAIPRAAVVALCLLCALLALPVASASALDASNVPGLQVASLAPGTPVLDSGDVRDGTYRFDSFSSSAAVVHTNAADGPVWVIVNGDEVTLVLDIYDPDKFNGLWRGKRSEAPADPLDSSVIGAVMVPAADYQGSTSIWTDANGLAGEPGASYKASRFFVVMSRADFLALLGNDSDRDFYYAIRRAPWSPSNAGRWMGENDNYFTFGSLVRVSDSTTFDAGGTEAGIARAKELIDVLPYDPYQVQPSDSDAIMRALSAYEGLPQAAKDQLDALEAANGVLSYGRTLECALWGLYALAATDDATDLADGTYTTQFSSTCNMGKSTSSRGFKFTVTKIEVKDGHALATLEHGTASPDTLRSGGVTYPHVNGDETAKSTFEIPIDLNSTFYVAQMGKNRTANTFAIPYEMRVNIDEAATPDVAGTVQEGAEAGPGATVGPGAAASAGGAGSSGTARTLVGRTASRATDAKGDPGAAQRADGASGESAVLAASGGPKREKSREITGDAVQTLAGAAAAGAGRATRGYGFEVAAISLILLVTGIGAFFFDYRRRDRRPVQISGVGLSGERFR